MAKTKIQDTKNSGFGNYYESTGGGQPFEAGNSNTRTTRANGKFRQENNDTEQPRDRSGHFTYKSVNGGSIDPKYGPSRGKTVNPLLTGGDGTIKIDDVADQFNKQSGSYWDKYKDKWYVTGSEVAIKVGKQIHTYVANKPIWEAARENYGGKVKLALSDANLTQLANTYFGGDKKLAKDTILGHKKEHPELEKGFQGESRVFDEVKKGRPSTEEAAARKEAKKHGEAPVISKATGGIKVKGQQPVSPTEPKEAEEPASPAPKYTPEDMDKARNELKESGQWNDAFNDDAILTEFMDKYWTPDEEESEETKKVRKMGFTDK